MTKTTDELLQEIADLKEELETTIDEKNELEAEVKESRNEINSLESEADELKEEIEELKDRELDNAHDTMSGKIAYQCEGMNDADTMQLFVELMRAVRPADLQDDLKAIIRMRGVQTIFVQA